MPRWMWLLLFALVASLWLASHRRIAPAANASVAGTLPACPLPVPLANPDLPMQSDVGGRLGPFRLEHASVSPLAGFSVQARVLGREDYRLDRGARYAPTDLALGWGPMSRPGLAQRLDVSQGSRWYRYRWGGEGPPIPPGDIALNSANMHIVPGSPQVAAALDRVSEGDLVRLDGWLIRIDADDGFRWQSSLTRNDVGAGACELVLVCSIQQH